MVAQYVLESPPPMAPGDGLAVLCLYTSSLASNREAVLKQHTTDWNSRQSLMGFKKSSINEVVRYLHSFQIHHRCYSNNVGM
jgi:hypothetical protein